MIGINSIFYLVVSMGVLCLSNVSSVTCFSSMPTIAWTHQSTVHASWGSVPCYQSTTFRNNPYPSKSGTQQLCMYVCMSAHFRPRSCYIQIYNKLSFVLLGLFLFLPGHAPYCRTMKQEMMMYMYCTYLGHLHLQNARCQWKQDRYEITVAQ